MMRKRKRKRERKRDVQLLIFLRKVRKREEMRRGFEDEDVCPFEDERLCPGVKIQKSPVFPGSRPGKVEIFSDFLPI